MRQKQDEYVLTPLSKRPKEKSRRIITIDIESKDGASQRAGFTRPFLTGLYDGTTLTQWRNAPALARRPWKDRHLERGGCIDTMMRACLVPEYAGARIYAHNGGAFDFLFCIAWLARKKTYRWSLTPQGPNILALSVEPRRQKKGRKKKERHRGRARKGENPRALEGFAPQAWIDEGTPRRKKSTRKVRWTFVDSIRLLPMSLAEAAKMSGAAVQKKKMALHAPETDPRWDEYHAADLRALHSSLISTERMLNDLGGEMAMTAPSAALRLFQRRFLSRFLERNKHFEGCQDGDCQACAHAFVRKAYKGGRVEVFRLSGKKLFYFDINSSYPAAMMAGMPAGLMISHEGVPPRPLDHYFALAERGDWVGFVECDVTVPEDCALPPLPYHEPDTGKLLFPVGKFSGVWDLAELALLKEVGGEVRTIRKLVLYPSEPIFRKMIQELYPLRDKRNPKYQEGLGKLVKLLLNALYGKFGQRPERTEVQNCPPEKVRAAEVEGTSPAGGDAGAVVWYVPTEVDQAHIMPQISAHITSLARVRLWWGMREVMDRGGSVYYLDTDSIVCDVALPSSSELGRLKREFECPNLWGQFVRPKVYRLWCRCTRKSACPWYEETCKKKGIKGKAMRGQKIVCKGVPSRNLDPLVFAQFLRGGKVHFKRLAKLRTMAREGLRSPWIVRTHKRMTSEYDKRIVQADGATRPIILAES